jgi:SWI/SNF-related matrix-associated actin-dependent regulator 1 of chromatin subfamily A
MNSSLNKRLYKVSLSFCKIDNNDIGFKITCSSHGEKLRQLIDNTNIHDTKSSNCWIYSDIDGNLLQKTILELKDLEGYGNHKEFILDIPSKKTIELMRKKKHGKQTQIPWHTLPEHFNKMYTYQREDIEKIITQHEGRTFIGHDMGCGKTMISLASATLLKQMNKNDSTNFMQIIICPSYLRTNWKAEIIKWGVTTDENIQLISKSTNVLDFSKIVIISYDLAVKMLDCSTPDVDLIICDESHYLKNQKTKRWTNLQPILNRTKYLFLITGTPALSRPEELFTQLSLLIPDVFSNWFNYTKRYCNGKHIFYGKRKTWDCSGCSNEDELALIISQVLVRRLKKDVLTDLPEKIRTEIIVPISKSKLKPMQPLFDEMREINIGIRSNKYHGYELARKLFQQKTIVSKLFRATCLAKIDVCKKVLNDFLNDTDTKAVFFAVHQNMLNALQSVCVKNKINFIRIDGNTPLQSRLPLVNHFVQNNVQIALLSIGACNSGFNLCPVENMFFTELSWTPGILLQCEDRLHRIGAIGQSIHYKYIIADETIDERVFNKLKNKFHTLDTIIDNGDNANGFISTRTSYIHTSQTIQHLFENLGIQTWTSNTVSYAPPLTVREFVNIYGIHMSLTDVRLLNLIPKSFDSHLHDTNCLHHKNASFGFINLNEFNGTVLFDDYSSFYAMTNLSKKDIEQIQNAQDNETKLKLFVMLCSKPVIIDDEPTDVLINIFYAI